MYVCMYIFVFITFAYIQAKTYKPYKNNIKSYENHISATALAARACFLTLYCLDRVVFCSVKGPQDPSHNFTWASCFWCVFCVVFDGAFLRVLWPTWPQHGSNLGPKRPPKSRKIYKKRDHMLYVIFDWFFIVFGRLLGGFLMDFQCQVEGQVD